MTRYFKLLAAIAFCMLTPHLVAAEAPLEATGAWARATPPGMGTAAVYLTLHNRASEEIAVMQVETPRAPNAEIHRSMMHEGMMSMVPVAGLVVPPGGEVRLEPAGLHVMLMDLERPLAAGERFPITFGVMGGESVTTEVQVVAPDASGP